MKIKKKKFLVALFVVFGFLTIHAQTPIETSSTEKVIGTISGERPAGEAYEIYRYQLALFSGGWKYVGSRDNRVEYSTYEMHDYILSAAKRKYGSQYPKLDVRDIVFYHEEDRLPDYKYYAQDFSGDECKKTSRIGRVCKYSATVVVVQ